jgi:ribosomal-protein-alanine N-acetyltransferase
MIPGIETSRLRIRPFTANDLDAVVRIHDDCFGRAPRAAREQWLDWTVRNYAALANLQQPPYGDYAIELKEAHAVIGAIGLVPSFGPFQKLPSLRARLANRSTEDLFTPEMGLFWAIGAEHRRRGYASEAAQALATFAFDKLHAARLVATTERTNAASIAVMRRLGMTIEKSPDPDPHWFQTVGVLFRETIRIQ